MKQLLSRIFTLAIQRRLTATNPCGEVRKFDLDNRRRRYLLDEEEPLLLAACIGRLKHLRPQIIVAVGTGMRRGDQFSLPEAQIDFQRDVIWVPNAKTGNEYSVPMSPEVREVMLEAVRKNPDSEYVFVNSDTGGPYTDLKKGFAAACSAACYPLHDHTPVSTLSQPKVAAYTAFIFAPEALPDSILNTA